MGRPKPPKPMRVGVNATGSYTGVALVESLQKAGHTVVAFTEPGQEGTVPASVSDTYVMEPFTPDFVSTVLAVREPYVLHDP